MILYQRSSRPWTEAEQRAWGLLVESNQVVPVEPDIEAAMIVIQDDRYGLYDQPDMVRREIVESVLSEAFGAGIGGDDAEV